MEDYSVIETLFRKFGAPYFVAANIPYTIGSLVTIGGQPFIFAREVPIETARNYWLSLMPKERWYWGGIEGFPYAYELVTD